MAKQLLYTDDARKKLLAGRREAGPRRRHHPRADRPQRHHRQDRFGGPTVTKDGVTVSKEIDCQIRSRTWAPSWSTPSPRRPATSPATAPPPPPSWPWRSTRKACATSPPAPTRWRSSAASTRPSTRSSSTCDKHGQAARPRRTRWRRSRAISANNDPAIGKLMADAFEKVGKDGVITVEEGKTTETTLEFVEGMQFDKGYISPYFITNPTEMNCELEDA